MAGPSLLQQVLDYANRANPYPLYAEMQKTPVARQEDGSYVVSTYQEILALLHDPRISSDLRKRIPLDAPSPAAGRAYGSAGGDPASGGDAASAATAAAERSPAQGLPPSFLLLDPPEHDRLRRLATRHFGPPHTPGRVDGMRGDMTRIVTGLIDALRDQKQIDIVDSVAFPFPVTVIAELLGVPREDEPRFHAWADAIVAGLTPDRGAGAAGAAGAGDPLIQLAQYMGGLIQAHAQQPGKDLISGLVTDDGPDGRMSPLDIVATSVLLLIAGHETTVNLITNGMLTLLRNPEAMERLRHEPDLIISAVEELLRFEPPVHMLPQRTALADITIGGTTIPKGVPVILVLAAGNRDPERFAEPDRFIPDRADNQHLGFGSGIHYCFGAPMARLEVQIALTELVRRLVNPRLVQDPPPYRPSPVLRGPRHLLIEVDGVRD